MLENLVGWESEKKGAFFERVSRRSCCRASLFIFYCSCLRKIHVVLATTSLFVKRETTEVRGIAEEVIKSVTNGSRVIFKVRDIVPKETQTDQKTTGRPTRQQQHSTHHIKPGEGHRRRKKWFAPAVSCLESMELEGRSCGGEKVSSALSADFSLLATLHGRNRASCLGIWIITLYL